MAKKKVTLHPPAELKKRENDVELTIAQFLKLGFFTRITTKAASTDTFPGTLALRCFRKDDIICEQGKAGWTAFWTLPSSDVRSMLEEQLAAATNARTRRELEEELDALQKRLAAQDTETEEGPSRRVATVHIAFPRKQEGTPGLIGRIGGLFSKGQQAVNRPRFIPVDAPTSVNYDSREAPIWEDDIFGEMSCMDGRPRSATIVADRDFYALEMLRNIYDMAEDDQNFQKVMDGIYRKRVLQTHLLGLPIFQDLTEKQFASIRDRLELERYEDGTVICKEGEPSDCMYIIRQGLVKVVKNYQAQQIGPEIIAAYCSKGEFIGEMGLMNDVPRNHTCIAYVHPEPPGTSTGAVLWRRRNPKRVELVRISKEIFDELIRQPNIKNNVDKVIKQREEQNTVRSRLQPWDARRDLIPLKPADELGLVQGQKLMLIDLDRCTRCDECVQACVKTHADGRSRLFLDGERFGRYLVPSTCRACLDPVCLIGCPVGSIHRGDNNQIVIEDWCIGCKICANNCPYGSIQMHDVCVLPPHTYGWRYQSAESMTDDRWTTPTFADVGWQRGAPPFYYDRGFRESLQRERDSDPPAAICFRYALDLEKVDEFRLGITSTDTALEFWVNGKKLELSTRLESDIAANSGVFQAGRNLLAARLKPTPLADRVLFSLRIDEIKPPQVPKGLLGDEFSEKLVKLQAVVCDMCSDLSSQEPACVTACPHDAAMRFEARKLFEKR